jgi:hypothetical protein
MICCLRVTDAAKVTTWKTAEAAALADRDFYATPCSPGCEGRHLRMWCEPGRLHVERGMHDRPPVPDDLGAAFRAAGYFPPGGVATGGRGGEVLRPADCPHPTRWNPPLNGAHR